MERIQVTSSGPLRGKVRVSGAKNAALPIIAASLLGTEDIYLEEVPDLKDVKIMCQVLESLGADVQRLGPGELKINASKIDNYKTKYELMSKMRASFLVMGPLLGRLGRTENSLPGGCNIGSRPIDLHLKGFRTLGVEVEEDIGNILAYTDHLKGGRIYLDFPSVGATENIMMAAVLADGETIIDNAAMEPEIVDLASFLGKLGARVTGAGTSTIRIRGVKELGGTKHSIIPDRIEAGTLMVAGAITGGDVLVENVIPSHLKPVMAKLQEAGCLVEEFDDAVRIKGSDDLKAISIKTLPYPGFPTDMQAQFIALMTQCKGTSTAIETVFENRFMHVDELKKMKADISVDERVAMISGGKKLKGAKVNATDLRAGAALILAGLVADGVTEVGEIYHIDRGYENIEEKFKSLGANIQRVQVDQ